MAYDLRKDSYYTFDHDTGKGKIYQDDQKGVVAQTKRVLASRYAVLSIIFAIVGSLIFYNTAALQLNASTAVGMIESSGIPRQQTVRAPRGDIVDTNGIPLAYSQTIPVLYLTYAGLEDDELNAMLLDLAELLNRYDIKWTSKLTNYLDWSHETCSHEPVTDISDLNALVCGEPQFMKDAEAIDYWQTDKYQLGLFAAQAGQTSTFKNDLVKPTANDVFEYLLYNRFQIEDPEKPRQYTDAEAFQIMKLRYTLMINNWLFKNGTPLEIARNVDPEVINFINEQNYRFRGVISGQDSTRVYTDEAVLASHVLGYTGRITSSQYEELKPLGYAPDAMVGQAGIEQIAERYLAGQDGVKPYNIWTVAGEAGTFFSEAIGKDPEPGYDVRLTLDLSLQKVAQTVLASTIAEIRAKVSKANKGDADSGAVVMLDVRTGAVLAMASYPYYNPNDFIQQATDKEAAKRVEANLLDGKTKPMLNRAIQEIYAPGSTFKPATSIAALETGVITPFSNTIRCVGTQAIANWTWHCLEYPTSGHGDLSLTRGLATSCNMYFYTLGNRTGIDAIDKYAGLLGLGNLTGIDLPNEAKGYRSSKETKTLLRSNPADQLWYPADTCQSAIGQFDNSFTVIQLATYAASLATGNKVTPHLIDTISTPDGVIIKDNDDLIPVKLPISAASLEAVRAGMIAVANDPEGTATSAFRNFPIKVAAKTGTAETGFEDFSSSNGLFICYAPADNPQVAIAQIVEKGAWGSNTIGIAKALLSEYFDVEDNAVAVVVPIDSAVTPATTPITPATTTAPTTQTAPITE
ncbi:MAG: penicillin-binding transpeptidase domain-containing protein [Eubacteriales bacterium]|nr:penicillin-binding transpeptidase domain-containing protein [Eubacteriales bacterium]